MSQDPPAASGDADPPHSAFPPGQWPPPPPPPGWAPPPGWGQPPPPYASPPPYAMYAVAPPRPTNGLAIASLVLGVVWVYWLGSVLAVVFGHIALHQIKQNPHQNGRGLAIAGVVLGWAGVATALVVLPLFVSVVRNGTP